MENKIDSRYFRGLIALPNLNTQAEYDSPSSDNINSNISELDLYITEYQEEFFIKLFGSDVIPTEVEADLIKESIFRSPIADYVFCQVIHQYQSQLTESGEKIHNATESQNVSYQERFFIVWNRMVKDCVKIRETLYTAGLHTTYPTEDNEDIYNYKSFLL